MMRPSWPSSSNRGKGRGRGGRTNNNVLAQIGNQRLIAANITKTSASTSTGISGIDASNPMYKEFMDFIKSRQQEQPSYSAVANEEVIENIEVYDQNDLDEIILILDPRDLQWKDEPWQIMTRYFDTASYAVPTYKFRMHYEIILSSMGSAEFQHFYPANTRKVYNFSKIIIKKIVTPEEWGTSTMREREYTHPEQKTAVRFNYWDYVESFNKALLYENANRKHSWFIKICSNNFKQNIPNWFCKWWTLYGPTINILPENYKRLYAEWVDISPKILQLQKDDIYFKGISIMYFFIEFSIPWIMKWTVEVQTDGQEFPCLKRKFHTKFWSKLLHKNPEGQLHG